MAESDIHDKIQQLLTSRKEFKEEMEVVYFLAEVRKYMDHHSWGYADDDYVAIRFYCDWALHTEKDRNLEVAKRMLDSILLDCGLIHTQLYNDPLGTHDFLSFSHLAGDLVILLKEDGFDVSLITDRDYWLSFTRVLSAVLKDQPLKNEKKLHDGSIVPRIESNIREIRILSVGEDNATVKTTFYAPLVNQWGESIDSLVLKGELDYYRTH